MRPRRYKAGDRVTCPVLGKGTVENTIPTGMGGMMYVVRWDETPPYEYNMACPTSLWWPGVHERKEPGEE